MIELYFTDFFSVPKEVLDDYAAFDISLLTDLPLFIDPFLIFNSEKKEYQELHDRIIKYLCFLRDKSGEEIDPALLRSWFYFSEVKQTWLGFCESGNSGRGLGAVFARALNEGLQSIFADFGEERITTGSHLEKLCLIKAGVGRDMISDFTTNLIKRYLIEFTETFAKQHIQPEFRREVAVRRVEFSYRTETWMTKIYDLPYYANTYVLLTPIDMLTRDETWINRDDLLSNFENIPIAMDNPQLRAQINNYFLSVLPKKPSKQDRQDAASKTIRKYPEAIDYYIKHKEDTGETAVRRSAEKVSNSEMLYIEQFGRLIQRLEELTRFYEIEGTSKDDTLKRIQFLKDIIENKGGYRFFYLKGQPIRRENDLQILFRLTWRSTTHDVSREVDDGRGPADYKISKGLDKTIVEFKLASNTQLKRNLERQVELYKKASDARAAFKVIIFFTKQEYEKVTRILEELNLAGDPNIVLIDSRDDNKPSGSKA